MDACCCTGTRINTRASNEAKNDLEVFAEEAFVFLDDDFFYHIVLSNKGELLLFHVPQFYLEKVEKGISL